MPKSVLNYLYNSPVYLIFIEGQVRKPMEHYGFSIIFLFNCKVFLILLNEGRFLKKQVIILLFFANFDRSDLPACLLCTGLLEATVELHLKLSIQSNLKSPKNKIMIERVFF